MKKGIDVSNARGMVDWSAVKNAGIEYAIIRAGYGRELSQKDEQFENNYIGCKSNGIPVGAFWYSYATSVDEAKLEAQVCLQIIAGKTFEYPIYFDIEEKSQLSLGKEKLTAIAKAFLSEVEKAGYWVGIYMSKGYLESYIDEATRKRYAIWVAQYNDECTYDNQYGMWQYGIAGDKKWDTLNEKSIPGVSGECDVDYCYIDYPSAIRMRGLNGFAKPTEPVQPQKPTTHTVQYGDTLYRIARNNNTTVQKLCEINGITNPDKIYAGQTLIIK